MSAEFFSIETDLDECLETLKYLDEDQFKMRRRMLAGVGSSIKNRAKRKYREELHRNSGELYKSIKRSVVRSGKAVVISSYARSEDNILYGYALAKGSTITAKNEKTLAFKIDDKWIRKTSVKLPERDYIVGPAKAYLESQDYRDQLDKLIQKEIDRAEKKAAQKKGKKK